MRNGRSVEKVLEELAAHFDARTLWVFLSRNRDGTFAVFSNQRPEQIRALAKEYLGAKRRTAP